jgi:hypothetical protein
MQTWFNLKEKTEAKFIGMHSEYPSKEHVTSGLHFLQAQAMHLPLQLKLASQWK